VLGFSFAVHTAFQSTLTAEENRSSVWLHGDSAALKLMIPLETGERGTREGPTKSANAPLARGLRLYFRSYETREEDDRDWMTEGASLLEEHERTCRYSRSTPTSPESPPTSRIRPRIMALQAASQIVAGYSPLRPFPQARRFTDLRAVEPRPPRAAAGHRARRRPDTGGSPVAPPGC
jgi:hypothetical protein